MNIFKTRYRVVQNKSTPYGQFKIEISKPSDFWVWSEYDYQSVFQTLDEAKAKIAQIKESEFCKVVHKE